MYNRSGCAGRTGHPSRRSWPITASPRRACIVTSAGRPPHRQPRPGRALEYTFSGGYAKTPYGKGPCGCQSGITTSRGRADLAGQPEILRKIMAYMSQWAPCSPPSRRILRNEAGSDRGGQHGAKYRAQGAIEGAETGLFAEVSRPLNMAHNTLPQVFARMGLLPHPGSRRPIIGGNSARR